VKMLQRRKIQKKSSDACDLSSIYNRLHRINGQIRAVERMLFQKRDCLAVLQQIVAAREAIDKVAVLVLESEARGCLSGRKDKKMNQELSRIINALFKIV